MSNKAPPYANKHCHAREVEASQRIHREKLASIKPTSQTHAKTSLDSGRPATMDLKHLKFKSKKMLVRLKVKLSNNETGIPGLHVLSSAHRWPLC